MLTEQLKTENEDKKNKLDKALTKIDELHEKLIEDEKEALKQ